MPITATTATFFEKNEATLRVLNIESPRLLLQWMIDRQQETTSVADICRFGPAKLRTKKAAISAVRACIDHGAREEVGKGEVNGTARRKVYQIVRREYIREIKR